MHRTASKSVLSPVIFHYLLGGVVELTSGMLLVALSRWLPGGKFVQRFLDVLPVLLAEPTPDSLLVKLSFE